MALETKEEKLAYLLKYKEYFDNVLKHNLKPGTICNRRPGSGFVSSSDPEFVKLPEDEFTYLTDSAPCFLGCKK